MELIPLLVGEGRRFQKVGAVAEKACLLGPTRYISLADGTHIIPSMPDLMGWQMESEKGDPSDSPGPCHERSEAVL